MPSRIGKKLIPLPDSVNIQYNAETAKVLVVGPKGQIELDIDPRINIIQKDQSVSCVIKGVDDPKSRALHGLTRSLLANAIVGVSQGWEKKLNLVGVGYRVALKDNHLEFHLGLSHPVVVVPPKGISFNVHKNTVIVSGCDKQLVGNTSAKIRSIKKPEPYKGKGIKYENEIIRRKAGKAAKAVGSK